ncbi:MAG: hypothetical protein L0226_15095 [Acidobacteria bacterium]|nr:hypothetical protein [Acidobacteriota bacterium]
MIKLGKLCANLQQIKDEMMADALPADIRGLTASELAAELEVRGVDPEMDREQEYQRRKSQRRLKRYYRGRRR